MNCDSLLELLLRANQLKLVPRTGWVMRGVPDAESVSDHTFGVAFIALVLAQVLEQPIDMTKLITIALLHDLPEVVLGDIPSPASDYLPSDAKDAAEEQVLDALLSGLPRRGRWQIWWSEFQEGSSIEAKLVRDADRLDMLIQAYVYAQTTGNCWLEEFWEEATGSAFEFEASRSLFEALYQISGRRGRQGGVG